MICKNDSIYQIEILSKSNHLKSEILILETYTIQLRVDMCADCIDV